MGNPGFPVPSPQGTGWGNPVSPCPNRGWERLVPPGRGMGNPGFPVPSPPSPNRGWERLVPPGRGMGNPGFPVPSPQGTGWGNPVSPSPNRGWERLAPPQARVRGTPASPYPPRRERVGETRFPHPPTAVGSAWRPHRQGHGEPWLPRTLPAGRGVGKPGFPMSQPRLGAPGPPRQGYGEPRLPRTLPAGRGVGKPGFPIPQPRLGAPGAPTGRGMGNPGFPVPSPQGGAWGNLVSPCLNRGWERLAPPQAGA